MYRTTPTTIPAVPPVASPAATTIVVGVLSYNNAETIAHVLRTAHAGLRTYFGSHTSVVVNVDAGSSDGTRAQVSQLREEIAGLVETPVPHSDRAQPASAAPSTGTFRVLLDLARKHQARACMVLSPSLRSITPEWIDRLVRPVLDEQFDLVLPWYARHRFEGTLTSAIVYPLTRALYGKRLRQPTGGDLAFSPTLADHFWREDLWGTDGSRLTTDVRASVEALCNGYRVGQAHVGPVVHAFTSPPDLSTVLADVLGSVFEEMNHHAPFWQKVRGSESVHTFGAPGEPGSETAPVDPQNAFESFSLGCTSLKDVWGLVLPPGMLLELGRLGRLPMERFEMPDALWARLVYDFALGYRLRTINRGHLLRAFMPLYLGWLASFMMEMRSARIEEVEARLERLALAYEGQKPYLISRWRWPDRFNP